MPHQAPSPTVNLATQQSRYTRPLGSGYLHTLSGSFSNRPASALGRMSSFATAESSYSASYSLNVGNLRDTGHSVEATPPAAMADEATKHEPNPYTQILCPDGCRAAADMPPNVACSVSMNVRVFAGMSLRPGNTADTVWLGRHQSGSTRTNLP